MPISSRGFPTNRIAYFVATRAELRAALPDWRVPAAVPTERFGVNPFTGRPLVLKATRDPAPGRVAATPAYLPFECALPRHEEDWEARYLALEVTLANEDVSIPAWTEPELIDLMGSRGLCEEALLGGQECWVYVLPVRMVGALLALREGELPGVLSNWNARSPSENEPGDLEALWALVRAGAAQGREAFVWVDAPASRG